MKTNRRLKKTDCSEYIASAELSMNRIQREVMRFSMEQRIPLQEMAMGLELRQVEDIAAQHMVLQLIAKVAGKKLDVKTVKFPDGPWQFMKFNALNSPLYGLRFVRWFLKRYPVRYIEITMEANAYHPDVAIPDHATFVEIITRAKYNGYGM